jgi:hypothetical protein
MSHFSAFGRQLSSTPNTTPTTLIRFWPIGSGLLLRIAWVMRRS